MKTPPEKLAESADAATECCGYSQPSGRRSKWQNIALVGSVWWCGLTAGWAHPAFSTSAEITIEADGSFHGQAEFDTLAFVLNDTSARIGNEPMEQLLAGPRAELEAQLAGAKGRFLHGFQVTTDAGLGVVDTLTFPQASEVIEWRDTKRPVLPVVIPVTLTGHLPPGARSMAVRFPSVLEQVILDVERPGEEPFLQPVDAGRESSLLPVQLTATRATVGTRDKKGAAGPRMVGGGITLSAVAPERLGTRFPLILGGLVLLSFAGAFGWTKWVAKP